MYGKVWKCWNNEKQGKDKKHLTESNEFLENVKKCMEKQRSAWKGMEM